MENTKIEWCDHLWSPWRGCTKVSPGCANCYAETLSKRNPAVLGQWGKGKPRVLAKNWNDPMRWNRNVLGDLDIVPGQPDRFTPYHRPAVFPSLCDWLDDEVPLMWLARFLKLIHDTPNLRWLLLTKRPELWKERMLAAYEAANEETRGWLGSWLAASDNSLAGEPPSNVWVGTSVEDQIRADQRIPALLRIPAVGRFLSVEPLLGPVDLEPFMQHGRDITDEGYSRLDGIHWVIIGGESGHGARPCNVEWIRSLVRQCRDASVPVFVKQLGANACFDSGEGYLKAHPITHLKGGDPAEWPEDLRVRQFPEGLR